MTFSQNISTKPTNSSPFAQRDHLSIFPNKSGIVFIFDFIFFDFMLLLLNLFSHLLVDMITAFFLFVLLYELLQSLKERQVPIRGRVEANGAFVLNRV